MIEVAARIVACFVSWMNDYLSHRSNLKSVSRHIEEALKTIKAMQVEHFFTITASDDNCLLINGIRLSLDSSQARKLFIKLRQKGVITIVISKGVRAGELQKFLANLASSGGFFHSYPHIAVKRGELSDRDIEPTRQGLKDTFKLFQIKQIFRDISIKRRIDMATVDTVVGSLMGIVRKKGGLLFPIKEDSDDLYSHSAKVAILSILQGEHLGLGNAIIYDIGLAALLHDAGKTLFPDTLLENQNSLAEAEWILMKNHPVYGAALLASLNKVPEIAIIVAYEHHKKYDGSGYPETRKMPRNQHIVSQIVAIADFYSAMITGLPHRKPLSNSSILGLLVETAGKDFNPLLVDNFIQAMGSYSPRLS